VALREEHRFSIFGNRVFRGIFGPKKEVTGGYKYCIMRSSITYTLDFTATINYDNYVVFRNEMGYEENYITRSLIICNLPNINTIGLSNQGE
jgi:hypothetical protein